MMKQLGVSPKDQANSSPVTFGDLVIAGKSNGQNENRDRVPAPRAPSMIAVDKKTGKLAWQVNSVGDKVLDGQWSSPAVATFAGAPGRESVRAMAGCTPTTRSRARSYGSSTPTRKTGSGQDP
jgi:hypothetical protein